MFRMEKHIFTYVYIRWRAIRASALAAIGVQCRSFHVIHAIRHWKVEANVLMVFVSGNDIADRRSCFIADQPNLILHHVVSRWERLHVQCHIRRIRHVHIYEGREQIDLNTFFWKIRSMFSNASDVPGENENSPINSCCGTWNTYFLLYVWFSLSTTRYCKRYADPSKAASENGQDT